MVMSASDGWPEAAIAIAGTLLVGAVVVVAIWQGLATLRARITASRPGGDVDERGAR
jgi:hypothetical protein